VLGSRGGRSHNGTAAVLAMIATARCSMVVSGGLMLVVCGNAFSL
jgi:hypothetical protein